VEFRQGRDVRAKRYLSEWGQDAHAYRAGRALPTVEEAPTRGEVQTELPERWALIDFWKTGADEFHAFVLTRDDFRVVKLPFPVEQLTEKLNRLSASLRTIADELSHLEGLNDLGLYLFAPLLPLLREKGIEGLYLVPHEFLYLFPLHAARFGAKYLCDEFSVAYLPSANLLPKLPRPDASGPAFLLANPEAGTPQSLPLAHWEGQRLRDTLNVPEERCFLGWEGTFAATERWADCGYVHFSCHGHGDNRFAPLSHLRLRDDLLLAHDVLHRRPALKTGAVVTLNGCQTAVPDWRAVNEGMGLMTAFLLRGAGVVFSTQWSVVDMCAAPMAVSFARQVRAGIDPMTAMRTAQQHLRKMTVPEGLAQMKQVRELFPAESVEAAKLRAQEAWLCWRAGLFDDAVLAAREAAAPLRGAGLNDEAELLLDRTQHAQTRGLPGWVAQTGFDSPVFWAAFQLVGRGA
jgi:CHAT domain-containing protein